jgi:hypothetical protein
MPMAAAIRSDAPRSSDAIGSAWTSTGRPGGR